MSHRGPWILVLCATALIGIAVTTFPVLRRPVLRLAGRTLVAGDTLQAADVIVVTADANGAGVLEAADLVHEGIASRVALFSDPPDEVDREFIRRGLPYEDAAERATRQLHALGVSSVEQIPRAVAGTEDEGRVLPPWCDRQRLRSVVVVSTADHSRRLRRVMRRSMKGHDTSVTVRPTRYSTFDPDRWWETRAGIRLEIEELEKLLLDVARHPLG